jgi:hypothetical protein
MESKEPERKAVWCGDEDALKEYLDEIEDDRINRIWNSGRKEWIEKQKKT